MSRYSPPDVITVRRLIPVGYIACGYGGASGTRLKSGTRLGAHPAALCAQHAMKAFERFMSGDGELEYSDYRVAEYLAIRGLEEIRIAAPAVSRKRWRANHAEGAETIKLELDEAGPIAHL